jgi:hypothetical protein
MGVTRSYPQQYFVRDGGLSDTCEITQVGEAASWENICVIVTDTLGNTEIISLKMCGCCFVGRSGMNNLRFNDRLMSRQHFAIEDVGGRFYISDLNTTNGTFVNGMRVWARRVLNVDDVITAGSEKIVFKGRVPVAGERESWMDVTGKLSV